MAKKPNRYELILEAIFFDHYSKKTTEFVFSRDEFTKKALELGVVLPKNVGDIIYSFRYRTNLPEKILQITQDGLEWIIRPKGKGSYLFVLVKESRFIPNEQLAKIKIPDATPGIISKYAMNDEQALLAKVRYNRLIDIFTGVTCYSLQNHFRTTVKNIGQIETDEIYIGINKQGAHFVIPVQAKGGNDKLGVVQIEQDIAMCNEKFSEAICKPIAAQFINDETIALFEFVLQNTEVKIISEKHYQLVAAKDISGKELELYKNL